MIRNILLITLSIILLPQIAVANKISMYIKNNLDKELVYIQELSAIDVQSFLSLSKSFVRQKSYTGWNVIYDETGSNYFNDNYPTNKYVYSLLISVINDEDIAVPVGIYHSWNQKDKLFPLLNGIYQVKRDYKNPEACQDYLSCITFGVDYERSFK